MCPHCTASQARFWICKRSMTQFALENAARIILRMESDKPSVTPSTALRCTFVNPLQDGDYVIGFCFCNNG